MAPVVKNKKDCDVPINYVSKNASSTKMTGEQALLIDTFFDEQNKWTTKLQEILSERSYLLTLINEMNKNRNKIEWQIKNIGYDISIESKLNKLLFKWFKIKSKDRKEYDGLVQKYLYDESKFLEYKNKYDDLGYEYERLAKSPPSADRYEVALLGNNIFKPR